MFSCNSIASVHCSRMKWNVHEKIYSNSEQIPCQNPANPITCHLTLAVQTQYRQSEDVPEIYWQSSKNNISSNPCQHWKMLTNYNSNHFNKINFVALTTIKYEQFQIYYFLYMAIKLENLLSRLKIQQKFSGTWINLPKSIANWLKLLIHLYRVKKIMLDYDIPCLVMHALCWWSLWMLFILFEFAWKRK